MGGWTIEVGVNGGALAAQTWLDHGFDLGLNEMDSFHATIVTTGTPKRGDDVKIWWDKGGPNERLWLRAQVTSVTQDKAKGIVWEISGYGDLFPIYQSTLGDLRDYGNVTPWVALQQVGAPNGLVYNSQGNLVMSVGTTAPNAINAGNQGNALVFRAHTGNMLLNIARLCEQATIGGGPQFGLEFFVDRDGGDARRFNLVSKRQRAGMVAESFQIGKDLHVVPSETNLDNDYNRITVIGSGTGRSRVQASVGTGTRELVFEDKNISFVGTAANLATRLLNALNSGSNERQEAETFRPNMVTQVGDDVSVVPLGGGAPSTLRCFSINYEWKRKSFRLELGRQRRFFDSYLRDLNRRADGDGVHSQITDLTRVGAASYTTGSVGPTAGVADGSNVNTSFGIAAPGFTPSTDEGVTLEVEWQLTDAAGTADVQIDIVDGGATTQTIYLRREQSPGTSKARYFLWLDSQSFIDFLGASSATVGTFRLTVTNRSGAARSMYCKLGVHVVRQHQHNA